MEAIMFEKQEASLCAQHALNMLLQYHYFDAVILAEIARKLDERENVILNHPEERSRNMDDSGFFSVQVIAEALRGFKLELVPITSPLAAEYRAEPTCGQAYICNLNEHWFTIRRFGFQWFKLNSLLSSPKLLSDTYLSLCFAQLENDGYSVFVVKGELPPCTADEVLKQCPVDPALASQAEPIREGDRDDEDLARAIALSLNEGTGMGLVNDKSFETALEASKRLDESGDPSLQQVLRESAREAMEREEEEMERQMQRAIQMSLEEVPSTSNAAPVTQNALTTMDSSGVASCLNVESLRAKRENFLKRFEK